MVDTSEEWILSRTGIEKRHLVSKGEATSDMCKEVALELIKKSGMNPEDIDLILIATSTPDVPVVSTAALVQDKIGAKNAWGYDMLLPAQDLCTRLKLGQNLLSLENIKMY